MQKSLGSHYRTAPQFVSVNGKNAGRRSGRGGLNACSQSELQFTYVLERSGEWLLKKQRPLYFCLLTLLSFSDDCFAALWLGPNGQLIGINLSLVLHCSFCHCPVLGCRAKGTQETRSYHGDGHCICFR